VTLVLASTSEIRRRLLATAGIAVQVIAPTIDEAAVRHGLAPDLPAARVAETLAEAKAQAVSASRPDDHVIGADQILVLDNAIYAKPGDLAEARRHLASLRGRTHTLVTAAVVLRDGRMLTTITESADLTMRHFSDAFLDRYLAAVGPDVTRSVGAYRLEELGAQLFDRIEGDYFTILGLPLLPLLSFLRAERLIPS
jgi:nucleoside triphosphate pyrophosphatase